MTRILARYPQIWVLTAIHAAAKLEPARRHQQDLILLEVFLPDLSGNRVLYRLRAEDGMRTIPLVVISGDAATRQSEIMHQAETAACLTKLLYVQRFIQAISDVLVNAPATEAVDTGAHGRN